MKNKNLQRGFAPFLIIAIVAILAIGGGVYVANKNKENKEAKKVEMEDNLDTQANANANADANVNANLGINANVKGSLRSLLGVGKNQMCTFSGTTDGKVSSGTIYISADGSMRADFTNDTSTGKQISGMIVKGGMSYLWSGTQGIKMDANKKNTSISSQTTTNNVDLDSQADYKCRNWTKDESKFVVPSSVNFMDLEEAIKGSGIFDFKKIKPQGN